MTGFYNDYLQNDVNGIIWERRLHKRLENPKCIEQYGFKVYSQNDEDGIIEEIFSRIGCHNKRFVEFGVQDGIESNGHYLLFKGWTGLWIECDQDSCQKISRNFGTAIEQDHLKILCGFITRDNINEMIQQGGMKGEIDLLSIDIDGNDYHIWEAVNCVSPRVVVIEYNAKFPPACEWVMPYCEQHIWDGSDKYGASLKALYHLGKKKGYTLVGTNINGVNAFFVRNDCLKDKFEIMDVEELYNPARYRKQYYVGHPSKYFLQFLPEGRRQLFANQDHKILFKTGFHAPEDTQSDCRWMAEKHADIWISDKGNQIGKLKIAWANPGFDLDPPNMPDQLSIAVEKMDALTIRSEQAQGYAEILLDRSACDNDEVLSIRLEVNKIWCPALCTDSTDTRSLGLMIRKIEFE